MVKVKVLVAQSCLTLCDFIDCRPPGSPVHEILQARIPERVAISFSRGSFPSREQTRVTTFQADSLSEPAGKPHAQRSRPSAGADSAGFGGARDSAFLISFWTEILLLVHIPFLEEYGFERFCFTMGKTCFVLWCSLPVECWSWLTVTLSGILLDD